MNYSELNLLNKVHFIYFKFNLNRGRFDSKSCVFISRILLTVQFNIIFIASLAILEKNYGFLNELAQEIDNISDEDRIVLQKSIDELAKDTPSTPVAVTRFKKIMVKAGQTTAGMFREILVDVLSEAAKKALFP